MEKQRKTSATQGDTIIINPNVPITTFDCKWVGYSKGD